MGKNKNKIEAPLNEEAQPEIIQPEELDQPIEATQETATNSDAEVTDMLESKPEIIETPEAPEIPEVKTLAPVAKGKSKAKAEAPVIVDEAVLSTINDRKKYTVIVIKGLSPLKPDTEKTVSGNVAKELIKKGLVKLKN